MRDKLMTYEEWEGQHNKRVELIKRERRYYIKQKLAGLALIAVSIISALIDKDLTVSVVFIPVGLFLIFTKQKVMTF